MELCVDGKILEWEITTRHYYEPTKVRLFHHWDIF